MSNYDDLPEHLKQRFEHGDRVVMVIDPSPAVRGTVVQVAMGSDLFFVRFDSGDQTWLNGDELRKLDIVEQVGDLADPGSARLTGL